MRGKIANLFDKDYETVYGYQTAGREYACLAATPSEPRPTVLVLTPASVGCRSMTRSGISYGIIHYIYAFDNVAFPYGEKSEAFIVERVVRCHRGAERIPLRWLWSLQHRRYRFTSSITRKVRLPVVGVVPAIQPLHV
ncbi:hypothetical protein ACNKHN_22835 [Shigella flexneri]